MAASTAAAGQVLWEVILDTSKGSRQLNQFANEANRAIGNLDKNFKKISIGDNFSRPLGRISAAANEFNKSLEASNARVLAFGASVGVLYNIQRAFTELLKSTIEVEASLKGINVILNSSTSQLKSFGGELFNIAKNTNQSFATVAKAATELARQGLTAQETLKRTRDALILVQLTGMDSAAAVESITAALNSFNKEAIDSTTLISKLAKVDAQFAVSAGDLAEAIRRVGSSAQDAGVGINELIALVTAAQQTTARGGSVIGNSLKTIFTRLQRSDTLTQLESLGVKVRDLQNNVLPANEVLKNFARTYDQLGASQKAQAAELVGGVFQINILKATLGDLSKQYSFYDSALKASNSATDEAVRRSKELNETLSALVNRTAVNFKQLGSSIGANALDAPIRSILSQVNFGLEAINQKDVEGSGASIGKGIASGIGQFLSGPGAILILAAITGITKRLSVDFFNAFKSVAGLNKETELQANLQLSITNYLKTEAGLLEQILTKKKTLVQVQNEYLASLRVSAEADKIAASITPGIAAGTRNLGIGINTVVGTAAYKKTKSDGLIPAIERAGAYAGGYLPGPISSLHVKGIGNITYNKAEKVVDFGMSQPAIIPPLHSKAGANYKRSFQAAHGFNPYNFVASGLVPDFAASGKIPGPKIEVRTLPGAPAGVATTMVEGATAAVNDFIIQIKAGGIGAKRIAKMIEKLATDFSLTSESVKSITGSFYAARGSAIKVAKQTKIFEKQAAEATALIDQKGFFGVSKRLDKAQSIISANPNNPLLQNVQPRIESIRQQRANRAQNAALGAAIGIPIATQLVSQLVPESNRRGKAGLEAVGDVGSFAALGFSFGGAAGAGIGGSIGAISGGLKVLEAFTDKLPDLQSRFTALQSETARMQESFQRFSVIQNRLNDIDEKRVNSSSLERERLVFEQRSILNQAPSGIKKELIEAFNRGDKKEIDRLIVQTLEIKGINTQAMAGGLNLFESTRRPTIDALSETFGKLTDNPIFNRAPILGPVGLPLTTVAGNKRIGSFIGDFLGAQVPFAENTVELNGKRVLSPNVAEQTRAASGQILQLRGKGDKSLQQFLAESPEATATFSRILGETRSGKNSSKDLEDLIVKQFGFEGDKETLTPLLLFFQNAAKGLSGGTNVNKQTAISEQLNIFSERFLNARKQDQESRANNRPDFEIQNRQSLARLISGAELQSGIRQIGLGANIDRDLQSREQKNELNAKLRELDLTIAKESVGPQEAERLRLNNELLNLSDTSVAKKRELRGNFLKETQNKQAGLPSLIGDFLNSQQKAKKFGGINPDEFNQQVSGALASFPGKTSINSVAEAEKFIQDLEDFSLKPKLEFFSGDAEAEEVFSKGLREFVNERKLALEKFKQGLITESQLTKEAEGSLKDFSEGTVNVLKNQNKTLIESLRAVSSFNERVSKVVSDISKQSSGANIKDIIASSGRAKNLELGQLGRESNLSNLQGLVSPSQFFGARRAAGQANISGNLSNSIAEALQAERQGQRSGRDEAISNALRSAGSLIEKEQTRNLGRQFELGTFPQLKSQISGGNFKEATDNIDRIVNSLDKNQDGASKYAEVLLRIRGQVQELVNSEEGLVNKRKEAIVTAEEFAKKEKELLDERIRLEKDAAKKRLDIALKGNSGAKIRQELDINDAIKISENDGSFGLGGVKDAFASRFLFGKEDMWTSIREGAVETADTIKSSFKDAFQSFVDGTENASDAARKFGISIFENILSKTIDIGADSLFGGTIGKLFGGNKKARGGFIKKFAGGGSVYGGSGTTDDVPALLSAGEFVVNRNSASKYRGLLENMNSQTAYSSLQNQFIYNGTRPTSGQALVDPNLSAMALLDENNPQNAIRLQREAGLYSYLREFNQFEGQKRDALAQFRRTQRQRMTGAYMSAFMNIAGGALSAAAEAKKGSGVGGGVDGSGSSANAKVGGLAYSGGMIGRNGVRHLASGGGINQYSSDSVPAVLTPGEYVLNSNATSYYGQDYLNRLNRKQIDRNGGLAEYTTPIRGSMPAAQSVQTAAAPQQIIENNVSINITTSSDGTTTADTTQSSNDKSIEPEKLKQLSLMIKEQTLRVINEQQRPGGRLYSANTSPRY